MRFAFGDNWKRYSKHALTSTMVNAARRDFLLLMDGIDLSHKSFLDVGFGQGLGLFFAAELGAKVVGLDIDETNYEAVVLTSNWFPTMGVNDIDLQIGSILSNETLATLERIQPDGYDIVHSWGALHHTGDMVLGLKKCMRLLKPGGHLIVSIYNRHWSSPLWSRLKRFYCSVPPLIRWFIVYMLIPIIWTAKFLVTGKNPTRKERGMAFYYDVVDWVGGYPYEYCSVREFLEICAKEELRPIRVNRTRVPTGCNEYVLHKPIQKETYTV